MDIFASAVSLAALVTSFIAIRRRESRTSTLERVAAMAVGYASKLGGTSEEKLNHAMEAARVLDGQDGRMDFTDAELRVAVEAALAHRA